MTGTTQDSAEDLFAPAPVTTPPVRSEADMVTAGSGRPKDLTSVMGPCDTEGGLRKSLWQLYPWQASDG